MKKREWDEFMNKFFMNSDKLHIKELEKEINKKDKIINALIKSLNTFGYKVEINDINDVLTVDVRQECLENAYKSLYNMMQNSARV